MLIVAAGHAQKKAIFYCIPSGNVSETFGQLTGDNEMLAEWGRDMYENWEGVTWGLTVAAVMGFLFLYFIAWFTKPVVWTVLLTILGFSSCTFLLALYETDRVPSFFPTFIHDFLLDKIGVPDEVNEYSWGIDAFTIFWGGVLGVTAVIVLAMRKRLSIAIGVIQESAAGIASPFFCYFTRVASSLLQWLLTNRDVNAFSADWTANSLNGACDNYALHNANVARDRKWLVSDC